MRIERYNYLTIEGLSAELDTFYEVGELYPFPIGYDNNFKRTNPAWFYEAKILFEFLGKAGGNTKYLFKAVPGGWFVSFSALQLYRGKKGAKKNKNAK